MCVCVCVCVCVSNIKSITAFLSSQLMSKQGFFSFLSFL